jgi:broad specificity phosphatase PhoE
VTLYLVRHAMPAVDPAADPATWPLGAPGLAAARALGQRLPPDALLLASDEPKAWQTLAPGGERRVSRDRRLGEVRRVEEFSDDFQTLRRRYVNGETLPGWEPQPAVARRFAAAIAEAGPAAAEAGPAAAAGDLVLASHGMAMTVWLEDVIGLADPGEFWAGLTFPDLLRVDLSARLVTRVHGPIGR